MSLCLAWEFHIIDNGKSFLLRLIVLFSVVHRIFNSRMIKFNRGKFRGCSSNTTVNVEIYDGKPQI